MSFVQKCTVEMKICDTGFYDWEGFAKLLILQMTCDVWTIKKLILNK